MQNQRKPLIRLPTLLAAAALAAAALAGCGDTDALSPELDVAATALSTTDAEMRDGLATLRRATARYHRVAAAIEDGFVQILPCVEDPAGRGALGIPYARLDRFDTDIDLSKPEILFYEPQRNGRLRLVGGEPVVPIALWEAEERSEPPSLFGQEFHRNDAHGLFGLHMWVWRHNPDGAFAFWHPEVSCDFAR